MKTRSAIAVLLALLLAACQDRSPVEYDDVHSEQQVNPAKLLEDLPPGIDKHYVELAQRVPGYGGHHFTEDGRLVVNLKNMAQAHAARSALAGAIEEHQRAEVAAVSLEFRTAEYDFLELTRWRGKLSQVIGDIPGVILIMTDPLRNRLVVGAADDATAERVAVELERSRIPRGAVILERATPVQLEQDLRSTSYFLQGGRRIFTPAGWTGRPMFCSIGYVGRGKPGTIFAGYNYMLTAGHCTRTLDADDRTSFRQPGEYDEIIGDESFGDLRYYNYDVYNYPCRYAIGCRQSDAVLVRLNGARAIREGEVARPTGIGSFQVNPADHPFVVDSILNTRNIQGRTVHKVGQATGWTSGTVASTCADLQIPDGRGGYIRVICMNLAGYNSSDGDSGAPVFMRFSDHDIRIIMTGVHHGKFTSGGSTYTVFSHPWGISTDINLTTRHRYGGLGASLRDIDWVYYGD